MRFHEGDAFIYKLLQRKRANIVRPPDHVSPYDKAVIN